MNIIQEVYHMKRFLALILCAMLLAGVCTLAAAEELPTVNIVVSMNTSTDNLSCPSSRTTWIPM